MQVVNSSFEELVKTVAGEIVNVVRANPSASIVLAGGSTFGPIYRYLAEHFAKESLWGHVSLYFGDERAVPPDDERSNYRFAEEHLGSIFSWVDVFRMRGEIDPEEAAEEYEMYIPDSFDLVLLGIGDDGHTASLFPGSKVDEMRTVVVTQPEKEPLVPRITLTMSTLNRGEKIHIVAVGAKKQEVVENIVTEKRPDYPVMGIKESAVLTFSASENG